ncbi:hypothetical protein S40293_08142 [Stachybotrys chartarum IBT 40293]|nr:hypothetical protein S40293_08142 [Stachybotrys chartarum IBT 40293]
MAAAPPPGTDLCQAASGSPPDTLTQSNFVDPPSLSTTNIAVSSVLLFFTYLFVVGRFYTNKYKLKWSDYFTLIGLIFHSANAGVIFSMTRYNRHQWDIPVCWYNAAYLQRLFTQILTFGMTQLFAKAAILLLYLEIFSVKQAMRVAIYAGLAFTTCLYLTFIPMAAYFNAPRAGQPWMSILAGNNSVYLLPWGVSIGIGSVLIDLYIFVLPLPVVSRLTLSKSKRLQLLAVFGIAFLGVIASIVGLVYRIRLLRGSDDSTWNEASVQISNTAENSVTLIVGSAPAFASFFKTHIAESAIWTSFGSMFRTKSDKSGKSGSSFSRPSKAIASPRNQSSSQLKMDLELRDARLFSSTATAQYDRLDDTPDGRVAVDPGKAGVAKTVTVMQFRKERDGSTDQLV